MELEETIKYIENIINATYITATLKDKDGDIIEEGLVNQQVIQDLLDLYNKEKQENNDLKENSIPKKKIREKLKEVQLPNVIVGGRRNGKTLEYGIKLGRIKAYEELLEKPNE